MFISLAQLELQKKSCMHEALNQIYLQNFFIDEYNFARI
jgi:hypothetical protein